MALIRTSKLSRLASGFLPNPDDYILLPSTGNPTFGNGTTVSNSHYCIVNTTNRTEMACSSWQGTISGIVGTTVTPLTTPSDPSETIDITAYDYITIVSAARTFTFT